MKTASVSIHIRVSPAESRLLEKVARAADQKLATWVRETAVREATAQIDRDLWATKQEASTP